MTFNIIEIIGLWAFVSIIRIEYKICRANGNLGFANLAENKKIGNPNHRKFLYC